VQRVASRLVDGLPEYLSVRREPSPGELTGARVHFLRPGEPFFEGLCDEIIERFELTHRGGRCIVIPRRIALMELPSTYVRLENLQT